MDDRPFDVSKLEEDLNEALKTTNDPTGSGLGLHRPARGNVSVEDRRSTRPLPKELTEAIQPSGSVEGVLAQRKTTHGDFTDNAAISQALKFIMHDTSGWSGLTAVQAEA